MAAVRAIIDQIANRNDKPHSWPDQTCVQFIIDYARTVLGNDIVLPPIFTLSETQATRVIWQDYNKSWFRFFLNHVSVHDYGREIPIGDLCSGDIVEFTNPYFECRGGVTGIGLIRSDVWLFAKGDELVLPIPVSSSDILSALRLGRCHQS